ncbi:hypothetical protein J0895_11900 [Phormidium pseudopriestleyi FRX01]|uniref:Uncharacterized protein n=1 Tax=Phormidium pseudopriestleyi FRX01 TaxID=1759528 RepID=A0ABS3FRR5_9CYAN|nr:hypothetical protein [Phormidium pseudopriestleyi]MBO0349800.1 hypothetical protein [Phormidium pseudopriestleyi FRX01]
MAGVFFGDESNPVPTLNNTLEQTGQYRGVHWRFSNALTHPMEGGTDG